MFLIEEGQAGWKYLYYIKTDGTVKVVGIDDNIESKVNDVDDNGNILKVNGNFEFKSKKIEKLKNIINVFRGSFGLLSGWAEAIFTDIEGNLFRIDSEGNIIKF